MDVEISFSGHLIRKLVLCSIPELILRPLKLCFNEILIKWTILSLPRCFLFRADDISYAEIYPQKTDRRSKVQDVCDTLCAG
jgi:hypothetical protein